MAEDKEATWAKISIRQHANEIIQYGPSFEVAISAVGGGPRIKALAQIDTGAAVTAISMPLAMKLKLKQIGHAEAHQPGLLPIVSPIFRVRLALPPGDIEIDVVGLTPFDPPHDILIGRDVLASCRLAVDFTAGTTILHIPTTP